MIEPLSVLAATVILAVGLILIRGSFFVLAERTMRLLDGLLQDQPDELLKQRELIRRVSGELRALAIFLLLLALVIAAALMPLLILAGFSWSALGVIDLGRLWNVVAMLVGGTLPFVLFSLRKQQGDYSEWAKLLHRMVLDNYHVGIYLFSVERKKMKARPGPSGRPGALIVSGLARAGTTALTTLLARAPAFHSLSYANMPFLLAPNLWRRIYHPRTDVARERSHGDKVLFSHTSVEALEEYFFKVFLEDRYITAEHLLEHEIDDATFDNYLAYREIVRPKGHTASIYLAKNNNAILRYRSLMDRDPELRMMFLFRDPVDHAYSLMKQHTRFTAMQEKDPFVLEYMNWLGHHEFGRGRKTFLFANGPRSIGGGADGIDHWLRVWIAYYTRLLELVGDDDVLLVNYADLLNAPGELVARIAAFTGTSIDPGPIEPFQNMNAYEGERDPGLLQQAMDIHARLVSRSRQAVSARA